MRADTQGPHTPDTLLVTNSKPNRLTLSNTDLYLQVYTIHIFMSFLTDQTQFE